MVPLTSVVVLPTHVAELDVGVQPEGFGGSILKIGQFG
jgi:hypothetical protein